MDFAIPMDLEVARTPRTRLPFQFMTLPPAASTLSLSSGMSGCGKKRRSHKGFSYYSIGIHP